MQVISNRTARFTKTFQPGEATHERSVEIKNDRDQAIDVLIAPKDSWVTITATKQRIEVGESIQATLVIDVSGLAAGNHLTSVEFAVDGEDGAEVVELMAIVKKDHAPQPTARRSTRPPATPLVITDEAFEMAGIEPLFIVMRRP